MTLRSASVGYLSSGFKLWHADDARAELVRLSRIGLEPRQSDGVLVGSVLVNVLPDEVNLDNRGHHGRGFPTMSHAVPPRPFQAVTWDRWNCNVYLGWTKVRVIELHAILGGDRQPERSPWLSRRGRAVLVAVGKTGLVAGTGCRGELDSSPWEYSNQRRGRVSGAAMAGLVWHC